MLIPLITALMLSSLLIMPVWAGTLSGKIIAVTDADTVKVLVKRTQHIIRLAHIDCPEKFQAYGTVARQALADLVFQKPVIVITTEKDRYDRWLGMLYLADGTSVVHQLIWAGHCWVYDFYSDDPVLDTLQAQARLAKVGLWADPDPIAPWVWRKNEKARRSKGKERK